MILDETYWTRRYETYDTPWQLSNISGPLKYIIDNLKDKKTKILIPGAGNSKEALYLLKNGFSNIHVLDISSAPLQSLSHTIGHSDKIRMIHDDFFEHSGKYDLILEQTFLCALESRFRESYPKKCHELLNENGRVQGVLFYFSHSREEPPYSGTRKEYLELFTPHFHINRLEPCLYSEPNRSGKELICNFIKK
ncbi:MAG: SAM-dependent methyltransferase [Nonlabens sp.]